jgi:hypothetical protein
MTNFAGEMGKLEYVLCVHLLRTNCVLTPHMEAQARVRLVSGMSICEMRGVKMGFVGSKVWYAVPQL